MKISNKIIIGFLAFVALNFLTSMVMLRNSLGPAGIGNGDELVKGTGNLKTKRLAAADFRKIEIEGSFKVILTQGEEFVEIEAEENIVDLFTARVDRKWLKIKAQEGYTLQPNQSITIRIGFEELYKIEAFGLSTLNIPNEVTFGDVALSLHGATSLEVANMTAQKLNVRLHGASLCTLTGRTEALEAKVSGTGKLEAEALEASTGKVEVGGAGFANVNVTEQLHAKTNGNGTINYLGNPEVEQHRAGYSHINRK
ncbi:MAG: head GIN domain-containing protein [Bacteroidota bacterium]